MVPPQQVRLVVPQIADGDGLIFIAVYPEHLVVYHAGAARSVFVGFLKINTIFLCAFSCFVIVPSFYLSPERPNWTIPAGESVVAVIGA